MGKNIIIGILLAGLAVSIFLYIYSPVKYTTSAIHSVPTTSLEEKVCEEVIEISGDCKRILLYDANSHLVFAEGSTGIFPILTNEEFTDYKKFLNVMDFQEFNEEKVDRGPIDWRAANQIEKNFSVIYGFAEDKAKTIVINSEGNIQPSKFFVRDNLWVWYALFNKDKVKLPAEVTVYDEKGEIIYGGKDQE